MRYLDTFLEFHNLMLQPGKTSKRDGLQLGQKDLAKLQTFLETHTPEVFLLADKTAFDAFVQEGQIWSDIFKIWGTLGFYEHKHGVGWFESQHFEDFLLDYQKIKKMVEEVVEKQMISLANLSWLNDLAKFQGCALIALNRDGTPFDGEHIDLMSHRIIESSGYLLDWHGIAISQISSAVYKSFSQLLRGALTIMKCGLPKCERIYIPSDRGRGAQRIYCSTSCRVKAYKNRTNLR